jgi:glucarate dehydratase
MRITELVLHPIAIADPPLRSSYGLHAPFALRTVVELKTDSGLTGFSETYGGDGPLAGLKAARHLVTGMDPFQLAGLYRRLTADAPDAEDQFVNGDGGRSQTYLVPGENPLDRHTRTFAAIEIACLDLIGKAVGKPACDVIGGRVRDEVSFSAYLFYKHGGGGGVGDDARCDEYGEILDPEACVRSCRQMIAKYGFREIKLKGGVLHPDIEIETIRALRREFGASPVTAGGYPLRIDPNCAWSVETSVRVGRELKEELSAGGYLEDPAPL